MRKHRIIYECTWIAALLVYLGRDTSQSLFLLAMLTIIPLISLGIHLLSVYSLKIEPTLKGSCYVEQEILLEMNIQRAFPLPMGTGRMRIHVENIMYSEEKDIELAIHTEEKKRMVYQYPVRAEACGALRFKVCYVDCYDVLGLFKKRISIEQESEIIVHPSDYRLQIDLNNRPETKNSGELYDPGRKGQDVSEVSALREYMAGDALSSIHWKLSGKLDDLIVREFGFPSNYSTLVLCDMFLETGDEKVPDAWNDAVLTVTSAVSKELLHVNLAHDVARYNAGELRTVSVQGLESYEQMILGLLCTPVAKKDEVSDVLFYFLENRLWDIYTKMICITSHYEEERLRRLAEYIDLTVIHMTENGTNGYTYGPGYTVINMNVSDYRETVKSVVI